MTDLKRTFNKDAEAYNRYRPHYPKALFDTLVARTHLAPGAHVLEIGPGTGQATADLAARGYDITGVELGGHLATKARDVLKDYHNARIITGSFESADLPGGYDLIYSATAFHWLDPDVAFVKSAKLLKDGGYLAIIHTEHISDEAGDAFFVASHPIYRKYEKNDKNAWLPRERDLTPPAFDHTLFELDSFTTFRTPITYAAEEYAGLIGTYSPTLALPAAQRAGLLGDIKDLINAQFGGSMVRHFAMTLTILKKR